MPLIPHRTLSLLAGISALGAVVAHADETWTGVSEVKFHGSSTLHGFDGTMPPVPLRVTVEGPKGSRLVSATSEVEVKKMNTAEPKRDEDMWAMFRAAQYRVFKVEVSKIPETTLKPSGGKPGTMPVTLVIAGVSGTQNAEVGKVVESPTQVSFNLAFPVSLKAYHLEPPTMLGGTIRVRDTVDVKAHVVLKKQGAK
jgi:hypothetical protein